MGIGSVIQPKMIRAPSRSSATGTIPLPVSSRISVNWSGAARTNAVPSVGCPANGTSWAGVNILMRAFRPLPAGKDEDGLRQVRLAGELLHPFRLDVAPVGEDGDRIPASGVSVKTSQMT